MRAHATKEEGWYELPDATVMMPGRDRTFEVYLRGRFAWIPFEELRKGDIFRAFEPDGTPVLFAGHCYFRADEDAKRDGSIDMTTLPGFQP